MRPYKVPVSIIKLSIMSLPGGAPASELQPAGERGVTLRVALLSLVLAALFGWVIPIVDFKFSNTFLGAAHLPAGAIAVLLVLLLLVNPLLRFLSRRRVPFANGFSRNEVLTVYITSLFSLLVPGRGGENFWIPVMLSPFYFATPENKWLQLLSPLKPWMTPALSPGGTLNTEAVTGWYVGSSGGAGIPWAAWLLPLLMWGVVVLALYFMLACLGVMLRAQWAENEALAFPLLRLPLEMTQDVDHPETQGALGRFFRNPLMWIGFGIAVFIEGLNGLNLYYPDIMPIVSLEIASGPLFTEPPWNQLGNFTFRVWPVVLGVSFLLTSEISFSLWFIYLFTKFQLILAYYAGFMPRSMPETWTRGWAENFVGYQQAGAFFAYAAIVLWVGREHYGHIVRRAFRRAPMGEGERGEAMSYPVAFWGFVASSLLVLGWTVAAGVRADIALLMWLTYGVVAIGLTRIVVEGGLLLVHTGWSPLAFLSYSLGAGPGAWLASSSVVPASLVGNALMLELRGFLLPSFVQSFKLAHDRKIAMRPLLLLIGGCILTSLVIGWWTIVRLGYDSGALGMQNWWTRTGSQIGVRDAQEFARGVTPTPGVTWGWFGAGALATYLIMAARSRFAWFALHPIGLLMCVPFAIYTLWFSVFLGWLCKVVIMRFGGTDSYRKVTPAFLGLALGDVAMMLLWVGVDYWQGRSNHQLMPG